MKLFRFKISVLDLVVMGCLKVLNFRFVGTGGRFVFDVEGGGGSGRIVMLEFMRMGGLIVME